MSPLFLSHVTLGVPLISFRFYMFVLSLFTFPVFAAFHCCQTQGKLPRDPNESQPGEKWPFHFLSFGFFYSCSFFHFRFSLRAEVMEGNGTQHTHSQNSAGLIASITSITLGAAEVLHFVFILILLFVLLFVQDPLQG